MNGDKDSQRKKDLKNRYDKLYEQKVAIEKAAENRKAGRQTLRLVTLKVIKLLRNLEMCQERRLKCMTT